MAETNLIAVDILRQLIDYDPETGALKWRQRSLHLFPDLRACNSWNARYSGQPALNADKGLGYRSGTVFNIRLLAHRVAFAIHTGQWPTGEIDHINGDKSDNRACNLRDVTRAENQLNRSRRRNNESGVNGVSRRKNRWTAMIQHNGKRHHLGFFSTRDEAAQARAEAEERFGFHPNHGRA